MYLKQRHHLIIYAYLQWPPRRKKPVLLKARTDVVEDVDAVVVTATTTTVTIAITIIIMTTAMIVDVTADAIKPNGVLQNVWFRSFVE